MRPRGARSGSRRGSAPRFAWPKGSAGAFTGALRCPISPRGCVLLPADSILVADGWWRALTPSTGTIAWASLSFLLFLLGPRAVFVRTAFTLSSGGFHLPFALLKNETLKYQEEK